MMRTTNAFSCFSFLLIKGSAAVMSTYGADSVARTEGFVLQQYDLDDDDHHNVYDDDDDVDDDFGDTKTLKTTTPLTSSPLLSSSLSVSLS